MIVAEKFNFSTVKGISLKQLEAHYKLYEGYVNKLNEIWNITKDADEFEDPNTTYSSMRSLKLGETYALDGVKLHNLYFENITGMDKGRPSSEMLQLIKRDFISYDNFLSYLKKVGLSMRGWAIVAIDPLDGKLHIIGSDAHDVGAVWESYPLLVLDVYEHAYFYDFTTERAKYIDIFLQNINWNVVNKRLEEYKMHHGPKGAKSGKGVMGTEMKKDRSYSRYCPNWIFDEETLQIIE